MTGPRNRETPGVTSSVTERLEAREVVTVCGSMRHYNQMLALANELTLEGKIVLLPFVLKVDDPGMDDRLQALHRDKIALSSAIYVVGSPDGQSTSEEVAFARARGLAVRLDGGNHE